MFILGLYYNYIYIYLFIYIYIPFILYAILLQSVTTHCLSANLDVLMASNHHASRMSSAAIVYGIALQEKMNWSITVPVGLMGQYGWFGAVEHMRGELNFAEKLFG